MCLIFQRIQVNLESSAFPAYCVEQHRILRFSRLRCSKHCCSGNPKSTAKHAYRNPRFSAGMYHLYILFAHVMTGVAHYTEFKGQEGIAPVAVAIEHMGSTNAAGVFVQAYPWLNKASF